MVIFQGRVLVAWRCQPPLQNLTPEPAALLEPSPWEILLGIPSAQEWGFSWQGWDLAVPAQYVRKVSSPMLAAPHRIGGEQWSHPGERWGSDQPITP